MASENKEITILLNNLRQELSALNERLDGLDRKTQLILGTMNEQFGTLAAAMSANKRPVKSKAESTDMPKTAITTTTTASKKRATASTDPLSGPNAMHYFILSYAADQQGTIAKYNISQQVVNTATETAKNSKGFDKKNDYAKNKEIGNKIWATFSKAFKEGVVKVEFENLRNQAKHDARPVADQLPNSPETEKKKKTPLPQQDFTGDKDFDM